MSFEVIETLLESGDTQLQYTHRLIPGPTTVKKYGLRFAESCNLPAAVFEEARVMCEENIAIYEVPLRNDDLELSREKLMFKAYGVLECLTYTDRLGVETAKDIKYCFWSAVADLPIEDEEMLQDGGEIIEEPAGALRLIQDDLSPNYECCESEHVPLQDGHLSDNDEISIQSLTTVGLNTQSPMFDSDSDDMEQDDDSKDETEEDDDDSELFEEVIRKHEKMYESRPWLKSTKSFDGSPLLEVTPRPGWGLLQSNVITGPYWTPSAGLLQRSPSTGSHSRLSRSPANSKQGHHTPSFQRMLRELYKTPDEKF